MSINSQINVKEIIDSFGCWFEDDEKLSQGKMTSNLAPYTKLFEPVNINRLKIKNRVVMGPMGNVCMADEMGRPSERMIAYYAERAKGGVGLITSGMIPVDWKSDPSYGDLHETGIFPRLDSHRSSYVGWRRLAEACHSYGARFFIQLAPGMGRVGNPECFTKKLKMPVSSSMNPSWYIPQLPCRPLTDLECRSIVKKCGQAANDVRELGFDGVYLHGHSGYLIEQMTDPAYNRRKIGRYSDWMKFGLDIVNEIRRRCGKDYPIYYRIDMSLALRETYGERMDHVNALKKFRNGRTIEMTLEYMDELVKAGVDAFDVDLGGYDNWWLPHPPNPMPPAVYAGVAKTVKEHFAQVKTNAGQPVVVIAVGKLGYPDTAEMVLRQNCCDMVMLARPLLADPQWCNKVFSGKVDEIIPCIGDHEGCLGQVALGGCPHCAVNPRTSFEHIYPQTLPKAEHKKKIAVIGAGPAGVEAACTAAQRGHEVTIFDANKKAGGTLLAGGIPKIKYDIMNYVDYLNTKLHRTAENYSLTLNLGQEADFKLLHNSGYDAIIVASGAKQISPPIKGFEKQHVVTGVELLKKPELAQKAQKVVVVGGSDVGCEVAHMLAYEQNKKVTVVEMTPYIMKKTCSSNRFYLIHHLNEKGVQLFNCTQVKEIKDGSVIIERNISKTVPDCTITWTPFLPENISNPFQKALKEEMVTSEIPAELVVLCTGSRPDRELYEKLVQNHSAPQVECIGDSFAAGRVLEAVKAGYAVGSTI